MTMMLKPLQHLDTAAINIWKITEYSFLQLKSTWQNFLNCFYTYNVLLGSVVFKCSKTCISERAASQYLSTFLTIFTATCLPPLLEKVQVKKKNVKDDVLLHFPITLFKLCNFYFDPLYLSSYICGLTFGFIRCTIWKYSLITATQCK